MATTAPGPVVACVFILTKRQDNKACDQTDVRAHGHIACARVYAAGVLPEAKGLHTLRVIFVM